MSPISEDPRDPRIAAFLEKSHATGVPDTSLVGILVARGWREKDVYRALGDHYRTVLGMEIPQRSGSGASAKDAFFYLLIFSTLATWTIGFGSLAFDLIERWLADPLFSQYPGGYANYQITWSLAALLVAFPLYLLFSRAVLREAAEDPYKLDSGIRKWLTYLALVVAATVFMGDLICALAFLLRGELTSRFIAKSLVVLALSGGVFFYYYRGSAQNRCRLRHAFSEQNNGVVKHSGCRALGDPGVLAAGRPIRPEAAPRRCPASPGPLPARLGSAELLEIAPFAAAGQYHAASQRLSPGSDHARAFRVCGRCRKQLRALRRI